MRKLVYHVDDHEMSFYLGRDCMDQWADILAALQADQFLVVADRHVFSFFGERVVSTLNRVAPTMMLPLVDGEMDKRVATLERLAIAANESGVTRRSVVISLGGGATGNIAGLFSALMLRGLRFVDIPTTFLAMHDSSTSLKQAVNLPGAKNQLGVYHAPEAVLIDTSFLRNLPDMHFWAGMVELVKNALVLDDEYRAKFAALLNSSPDIRTQSDSLVELGIDAKLRRLELDPHERREALVFEYGHTIGHAIEAAYYPHIHHGQAVYIGMQAAAQIAVRMNLMNEQAFLRHEKYLILLKDKMMTHPPLDIPLILQHIPRDNKRGYRAVRPGCVDCVLLSDVGQPILDNTGRPLVDVPVDWFGSALECL